MLQMSSFICSGLLESAASPPATVSKMEWFIVSRRAYFDADLRFCFVVLLTHVWFGYYEFWMNSEEIISLEDEVAGGAIAVGVIELTIDDVLTVWKIIVRISMVWVELYVDVSRSVENLRIFFLLCTSNAYEFPCRRNFFMTNYLCYPKPLRSCMITANFRYQFIIILIMLKKKSCTRNGHTSLNWFNDYSTRM